MLSQNRSDLIQKIGWAFATLKSATSTVNIGEGIEGCEFPVEQAKDAAKQQIVRIREYLNQLEVTYVTPTESVSQTSQEG